MDNCKCNQAKSWKEWIGPIVRMDGWVRKDEELGWKSKDGWRARMDE